MGKKKEDKKDKKNAGAQVRDTREDKDSRSKIQDPKEEDLNKEDSREKDKSIQQLLEVETEKRLKVLADFENFKKRVQKEREEMNLLANASMLNMFLEVMDDLNRAIGDMEDVPEGLSMIQDKVKNLLDQQGLEEIDVKVGDVFQPSKMEAIGTITVQDEKQDNKIIHVERKGYKLADKDVIVRGVRVIVGKKA